MRATPSAVSRAPSAAVEIGVLEFHAWHSRVRRTARYDAVREMARFIGERLMRAHPGDITLGDAWAGWPDGAQSVEEALTRDIDARESASAERRR